MWKCIYSINLYLHYIKLFDLHLFKKWINKIIFGSYINSHVFCKETHLESIIIAWLSGSYRVSSDDNHGEKWLTKLSFSFFLNKELLCYYCTEATYQYSHKCRLNKIFRFPVLDEKWHKCSSNPFPDTATQQAIITFHPARLPFAQYSSDLWFEVHLRTITSEKTMTERWE